VRVGVFETHAYDKAALSAASINSLIYEDTVVAQFRGADRCISDPSNDVGTGAISFVQFFGSALNLVHHLSSTSCDYFRIGRS